MKALSIAVVLLLLQGCSDAATSPDEPTPVRPLTVEETRVVQSTAEFGWKLFSTIAASRPTSNVVLSPLSVSMALGMALNGTEGETWSQMHRTLALAGADQAAVNAGYRGLIDVLSDMDPRVTTTIANSVWARQGFPVLPAFLDTVRMFFDAEARTLDFSQSDAADIINAWVKDKTAGRIPGIVTPPIPDDVVMYLINAVYFKGRWAHRFDKAQTRDAAFTDINSAIRTVPMMSTRATVPFLYTDRVVMADLPFGWDRYRMAIIVPRNNEELRTLETTLNAERFRTEYLAKAVPTEAVIELPRFTLECEFSLNDALKALGMPRAFLPMEAEFTRINPDGGLFISNVKHKTFLAVDEEGAEAAAATSVEIGVVSMPPTLRADRPFLFVIHEVNTGSLLFIGRVATIP